MKKRILNDTQEAILGIERHWLTNLQVALARFPTSQEDRNALAESVRQLDELFLLVVVGEFNSGKSAFLNALFGESLLEEGVTPTTARVQLLKYGKKFQRAAVEANVDVYSVPAPLLKEVNLVDTPGTNAIQREHEVLTQEFIPRSDMVLFVTSVERPFSESERQFLQQIREWGKRVVVVLNKTDILTKADDLTRVVDFVRSNIQDLLGFSPEIFPVSARQALKAKQEGNADLLAQSGMEALETYIAESLDKKERITLKLRNPLGVGTHLTKKYTAVLQKQMGVLDEDIQTMQTVSAQIAAYEEESKDEFRFRLADVDNELQTFENRGIAYFDDTIRLGRLFDLLDKSKLESEFKQYVVGDVPEKIEKRVQEIITWTADNNQSQWRGVIHLIEKRKEKHADYIVEDVPMSFEYDRAGQIDRITRTAQQALLEYNRVDEARRIAESLQRAVANTAIAEIGAVGLGTAITILATTTALDVTGIVAASAVAILGLLVIPSRKRQLKQELRERIAAMSSHLMTSLTRQFDVELERSMKALNSTISPYTRYVTSERKRFQDSLDELSTIRKWLERQLEEIEAL